MSEDVLGKKKNKGPDRRTTDISDKDIYDAMKDIHGYLDVTPQDIKEIYLLAYRHAIERLANSVRAKDIMMEEVVVIGPETPIGEIAEVMARHGISGVPVVENGRLVGMVTERDLLKQLNVEGLSTLADLLAAFLKGKGCASPSLQHKKAGEIMTSPVRTINEETPLAEIAHLFSTQQINRAPVLSGDGTLVGIVSRNDIVRASL
jgi:CBS domain-containing membrane protein